MLYAAVTRDQPYRELFVWAVLFSRMPLAEYFWKDCPDQMGSALVASMIFKSLAHEARLEGKLHLADELDSNAGLVLISAVFCDFTQDFISQFLLLERYVPNVAKRSV